MIVDIDGCEKSFLIDHRAMVNSWVLIVKINFEMSMLLAFHLQNPAIELLKLDYGIFKNTVALSERPEALNVNSSG